MTISFGLIVTVPQNLMVKWPYYNASAYAIKWEYQDMNVDAFAIFSLDEEGKAQPIKMKGISSNIDFSFDFQDLDFQRIEE